MSKEKGQSTKDQENQEIMHWADQIAKEIKEHVESVPELKKQVEEHGYILLDEKTPSGVIHIGSGRGWIFHDVIAKALRDLGLNAKFILSSDDIDPYDKPLNGLPEEFNKYLGVPFRNIPSPVEGYGSMAEYFFMQCVEKFDEFGIDAEIQSTGESYENGEFNESIKIILNNHKKVAEVFEELYKKPYERIPFNVICEKCGKIATTKATKWDPDKELLSYSCEKDLVAWAEGCGHTGEISPYNGNGKFPWKVEWAAKWPTKKVVYEIAGKDHFTKLGARDAAIRVADQVLNYPVPLPSKVIKKETHTIYDTGKGYEFFNVGGKKMSTSKGQGVGFAQVLNILPGYLVRYLLIRSRPHSVIDFDPYGRNDLILLFDRYDKTQRIYYKKEEVDEKEYINQKRIYELSHVGKIQDKCPVQVSLMHAATVIQVVMGDVEKAIENLKRSNHIPKNMGEEEKQSVLERLNYAKRWLDNFAPDEVKFIIREGPRTIDITQEQKAVLKELVNVLTSKQEANNQYEDAELHNVFYEICKEASVDTKEFFKICYTLIIDKERGPKLAAFMNTIGYERIISLLQKVIE